MNLDEVLLLEQEWKKELHNLSKNCAEVILFGNGYTSEYIVNWLSKNGIHIVCFCDNDMSKQGKICSGFSVYSPEEAKNRYPNAIWYITTQLYYVQIRNQLIEMEIEPSFIINYDLVPQFDWEHEYKDYVVANYDLFCNVLDQLADEESKRILIHRIAFLITRRREWVTSVRGKVQYFEPNIIDYKLFHYFIDVGSYIGDTMLEFKKFNDLDNCHIYAFEFDEEILNKAKENTRDIADKVTYIQKALSNKTGFDSVKGSLGIMQSINNNIFENNDGVLDEKECFETTTLDYMFDSNYDNTFLKMDIEGAELLALEGGKMFITNNIPSIAICVYHKKDDVVMILNKIREYYSGYKFFLRHYSDNQTETVLYAIK